MDIETFIFVIGWLVFIICIALFSVKKRGGKCGK